MIERLRALLARTRNADGGWPYYAGRQSRTEPTCWAVLALGDRTGADRLAQWRTPSGLVADPGVASPNFVFNAMAALTLEAQGSSRTTTAHAIARALLEPKGVRVVEHPAIRQDSSLQGWPWMEGTFSWVEPTAWSLLAVKKLVAHVPEAAARIAQGEALLRDRVCQGGGWNHGNKEVYDRALLPYVPNTAAGVLALQNHGRDRVVLDAVSVLLAQAPREGSTTALAVSWIALSAVGTATADLAVRLAERIEVAERIGNLASLAMSLYVLQLDAGRARPAAFMLAGAEERRP
jgi:hypothetical protein